MSIEDLNLEYEYFLFVLYRVHRLLHEIMELVNEWAFIRNDTIQGWARYTSLTKKEELLR